MLPMNRTGAFAVTLFLFISCTACTSAGGPAGAGESAYVSADVSGTEGERTVSGRSATLAGTAAGAPEPAAAALPPGALVELVPSAVDLPPGFTIQDGAGPIDLTGVAALSSDPKAAASALHSNDFVDGYSAEYADQRSGAFLSARVLRFSVESGARADFAREVRESAAAAESVPMAQVGDESAAFREKVPEGDVAEIVSVRFRVRDLVWLVETGSQESMDAALAHNVAANLARRAA